MMSPEPMNIAEILENRRKSADKTLREVSHEELHAMVQVLFPDVTNPWYEACLHFLKEHRHEQGYRGETEDGYGFVYFPDAQRGLWYMTGPVRAVGIVGERALKALAAIHYEHQHPL